jgi:cellobiose-specific phosphotransferase system component IIB
MQVLLPDWSAPDTEEHLEPLFCDLEEAAARRQEAAEAEAEAQARTEVHGVPADVVLAGPSARHDAQDDSDAAKYGKYDSISSKYGKCDSVTSKYGNGDSAAAALPPRLLRCYPPAALARVFRLCGLTIGWYADCMMIA